MAQEFESLIAYPLDSNRAPFKSQLLEEISLYIHLI
jgi:hypothetical protein